MSVGDSPGPTWTTLREPTETSSVMRSSDDDGDDELEVENELTDMPLQKRKAQYSPSSALRANKFPRLGLGGPSSTNRGAQGTESNEENGPSDSPPSVSTSRTLSTRAIDKFTSTKSTLVGGSSSDEFGGTLTQVIRQASSKERLDVQKKDKGIGVGRDPRRDVPGPTSRVVARKHVNGRPRVSTGSLLNNAQRSNDPDSSARTRVRPKRRALVVNRNTLLTHSRPLDTARRRSNPEVIELSDSDGRRGSHGTGVAVRNCTTTSNCSEDPIVISSDSEGDSPRSPAHHTTLWSCFHNHSRY
ncbi:hypothetical protein EV401DRAFT_1216934 [Pisolithus croceorrhizus]|nr:hypothetical protein EV401DRAFT_1216934 [Pisolithus croceorrhizus]